MSVRTSALVKVVVGGIIAIIFLGGFTARESKVDAATLDRHVGRIRAAWAPKKSAIAANRQARVSAAGVTPTPFRAPVKAQNINIRKLALAVAYAETSNCTAGTGLSKNNCHGIFECKQGKCGPKRFANREESFAAFESLWLRKYGDRFPTLADAQLYTDGPGHEWLATVTKIYNMN